MSFKNANNYFFNKLFDKFTDNNYVQNFIKCAVIVEIKANEKKYAIHLVIFYKN